MPVFLLLLSLARADIAPEPCDGLNEGDACTQTNGDDGTCTSCGTDCLECTAGKTEDKGCSTAGGGSLGLLGIVGLLAMRRR